jgi:hypothetical protein
MVSASDLSNLGLVEGAGRLSVGILAHLLQNFHRQLRRDGTTGDELIKGIGQGHAYSVRRLSLSRAPR